MAVGDLTSLADVKAWLSTGGPASPFPSLDDALLARLITAESQAIANWLQRPILSADWLEYRDGGGLLLAPREAKFPFAVVPCSAVLLVVVDTTTIPAIPPAAIAPPGQSITSFCTTQAGYLFTPTQLIIRGYPVPRRAGVVMMQYTAGYSSVPADVAQACVELVALRYRERGRIGEISKHMGDGATVTYERKDLPDNIKTMLQPYRLVAPLAGAAPVLAPTATDPATLAGVIA